MTGLLTYIASGKQREILAGEVIKRTGAGIYLVNRGNRSYACRSGDDLAMGSRVLFTMDNAGYVVLKKSGQRNIVLTEVVVNG